MKKIKLKLLLPLLLAFMLALGSCLTVCASSLPDYSQVDTSKYDSEYPYYFFVYYKSTDVIKAVFSDQPLMFSYNSLYSIRWEGNVSGVIVNTSNYGVSWGRPNSLMQFGFTVDEASTIYTNYDIKNFDNTKVVFFRPPLAVAAVPLKAEVLKQMKIILPVGVGCLALLTGSVVLLPRLRRSLLRL